MYDVEYTIFYARRRKSNKYNFLFVKNVIVGKNVNKFMKY